MKKSIIAAGAASVALAAMPVVGAFAADPVVYGTVSDNINASIATGCALSESLDKSVTMIVTPGGTQESTAAASVSTVCNNGTWYITAVGATSGGNNNSLYSGSNEIASAATITAGTSSWAFKVSQLFDNGTKAAATSAVAAIASGYDDYSLVPTTATTVATIKAAADISVNTQYRVYASNTQTPGTYTGKVTYTVTDTTPTN